VLELRPNCECCDRDLPVASEEAMICSFECTFCRDCVRDTLQGECPNCGGNFYPRPVRPTRHLEQHPASRIRIHHGGGPC